MTFLNKLAIGAAGISVLIMTIIGGLDVIGSNILSRPFPATYEMTELLMVLVVMLAISTLQARDMNISVDIITSRLSARKRRWLDAFGIVLSLFFFGLVAWQGWRMALDSAGVREYALGIYPIPVYPFKIAFAIGASLMVAQCALNLFERGRPERQETAD